MGQHEGVVSVGSAVIALVASVAASGWAQVGEGCEACLAVTCDVEARLLVDGQDGETLRAGQIAIVSVMPGEHIVQVTSAERADVRWEGDVSVEPGHQRVVRVTLGEELARKALRAGEEDQEELRLSNPARWRKQLISSGQRLVRLEGCLIESLPQRLLWCFDGVEGDASWRDALTYCASHSPDGAKGWRLPTIDELADLRRLASGTPYAFQGRLWSVTENGPFEVYYLDFWSGARVSAFRLVRERDLGVMCVRTLLR